MKVYLAGPIDGCTDDEAHGWRELASKHLGAENCLDPMRRDYRGRDMEECYADIVEKDMEDIRACDIVLANCWQKSWGTPMEIFFAHFLGKRVLAVLPPGVPASPWLLYRAGIYRSLDAALEAL